MIYRREINVGDKVRLIGNPKPYFSDNSVARVEEILPDGSYTLDFGNGIYVVFDDKDVELIDASYFPIKFRGKRADTGEWVYGDLLNIAGGSLIYFGSPVDVESPDYPRTSKILVSFTDDEIAVVQRDTIGQYIGLEDGSKVEVFAGDVIAVNGKYPKLIEYRTDNASFCMANIDELDKIWIYPWQRIRPDWWNDFHREIRIIGNIHDNPELLTTLKTIK